MGAVMRTQWNNRLAKLIHQPGGVKVSEAIDRAAENLETLRDSCLGEIDLQLQKIERLHAAAGQRPSPEVQEAIYRLSNDIHGVAGMFDLPDLGAAAYSLCELIERLRLGGRWNPAAIEVHLAAFRLFRHPEAAADERARAAVLGGLGEVVARAPKPVDPLGN